MITIGVDTGGTFTDFIYRSADGPVGTYKTLSTPHNPSEAVLAGIRHIARVLGLGERPAGLCVVHGSTVATNAILERKGAPTALVANAGFTDVIEIGRQNRTRLYDLAYAREPHIVPPALRFAAPGRVGSDGGEIAPLAETQARDVAAQVRASGAESVAVCLLFSFLRPEHERLLGDALRAQGLPVSLSHEILAEFREFERTSTTVVNAYVSPIMTRYLTDLLAATRGNALSVMQSNGGSISAETAMRESVRTILSGPAGGAVGGLETARRAGFDRLIGFDMGGTSTDVCLMDGGLPMTTQSAIAGYPVKVPMIDIHTVGAGGGSIARRDAGGSLAVGPESAGAAPGPVCYGRGGTGVTVTDANLYLGRIVPDHFLGGGMALDEPAARRAVEAMASGLGLGPAELAEGILAVANANMERAIRVISVEKGYDPREFTLLSFGGAGGMHCAELARLLGMERVFIPANPGLLSAVGMLLADVVKDASRTVMLGAAEAAPAELEALFAAMEARGLDELRAEGVRPENAAFERYLDMRYKGQSFELTVPWGGDPVEAFEAVHERHYGHRNPGKPVELVNLRLRSRGRQDKPVFPAPPPGDATPPRAARLGARPAIFGNAPCEAQILNRARLRPGNIISGPAIITEYSATIVLPPGTTATVLPCSGLSLDLAS
ncbi:hydantoinase/oxoprolinase family protein [Pseudodesulfovibrio sp.]|uniref:hydantoinase/oxoprolinase family protein n=1 Tax=Pseudodesulfovibrio sp. TaxID=2035812 RepID=UPI00261B5146|nr:hydantoinase/oxoprolinase family protein [Pseudodesulfovibrio sp.]MDD3312420.1 hydantoinase/oxoprolinase family protein [Pseudodesulfovibrio sp.]